MNTFYSDGKGGIYTAIQLSWDLVAAILGRPHDGSPEDDAVLKAHLEAHDAPAWVADATGWGLIGPKQEDQED